MIWRRKRDPLARFIATLEREGRDGRLRLLERLPPQTADYAEPLPALPRQLAVALRDAGAARLYRHQVEVLALVRAGSDVALVTPTASGKTLAFATAICERWLADRTARAICVYPTNALIHDQERALRAFTAGLPDAPRIATLTGATTPAERQALRSRPPAILLTNPELLHLSLAGGQAGWAGLLAGLAFVVLDEAHSYRGVFGAHMALTVRRLLRAADGYGAKPRIIIATATVGNPAELAEALSGRVCTVVEGLPGARAERTFAVWQPKPTTEWMTAHEAEAARLFAASVRSGLGTILFMPSRRGVERAVSRARAALGQQQATLVAPYRGGYTPEQRRLLEARLRAGELRGVVATNALELGIDVGGLAVAISAGFPGSRTSLWQQLGRAGRGEQPALALFVPSSRAVDGYYREHPRALLARPFEDAIIDLGNTAIVAQHLVCAAAEASLRESEVAAFGGSAAAALAEAMRDGRLRRAAGRLYATERSPHGAVALRGGSGESLELYCGGALLGTLDAAQLGREGYPGATYLHESARYRVVALDRPRRRVELVRDDDAGDSAPVIRTSIGLRGPARVGVVTQLLVKRTTVGFVERQAGGKSRESVLEPAIVVELLTSGFWLCAPPAESWPAGRDGVVRLAALHALEHLLPAATAVALACDPHDIVATAITEHREAGGDAIFLYDAAAGGSGLAERIARQRHAVLCLALDLVRDCPCRRGCPRCVLQGVCWRAHTGKEKRHAADLLAALAP